jgi:hypothetical protein
VTTYEKKVVYYCRAPINPTCSRIILLFSDVQLMDSTVNIFLAVGNDMGGINCSFKNNDVPSSVKGQEIKVKGRCTGFLIDVNLVDVVLIK